MKLDEVNNLPAYAVYKNLIPGVKVYQDTNKSPEGKKRNKKKSLSKQASVAKVERPPNKVPSPLKAASPSKVTRVGPVSQGPVPNDQKNKRNLKRKSNEGNALSNSVTNGATMSSPKKSPKLAKGNTTNTSLEMSPAGSQIPTLKKKKGKKNKNSGLVDSPKQTDNQKKQELIQGTNKKSPSKVVVRESVKKSPKETGAQKQKANMSLCLSNEKNGEKNEVNLFDYMNGKPVEDSVECGKNLFHWLIGPKTPTQFMSDYWEKKPLFLKRSDPDYFKWLLSSTKLDDILRKNVIRYGKNVDITSYTNGQRETHNPVGRAMPAAVWDYYANGCSIRFLNPQTYVKQLWRLNALLQEYFGTFVGANVYLTPPDSQGFAPHYDDIEAFVLQVEGKKHWKVYKPRNDEEVLPRFSSTNFSEETDNLGEPVLDVTLEEGDLLYFPRGYIHQAEAVGEHSLHITVSCFQLNSWGDLMKEYLNTAVDQAVAASLNFRKGLPTDYLSYMGVAHQDSTDKIKQKKRKSFINHTQELVQEMLKFTTPDSAADQLGKKFLWDSLPPFLSMKEKDVTTFHDGEFMDEGQVFNRCELDPDVEVKLVRKNCVRLIFEENSYRLYFTLENSMEYHGEEPQFVEIPADSKDAITCLIQSYPNFIKIDELPIDDITTKVQLVADLWEKGIVRTKEALSPTWDDNIFGSEEDLDEEEDVDEEDSEDEFSESESDDSMDFVEDDSISESDEQEEYKNSNDVDLDYDEFMEECFGENADESDDDSDQELIEYDGEDYSSDDSNGLGKSYVEEINSEDEINGYAIENRDNEKEHPPTLVQAPRKPPVAKGVKAKKQNNKKAAK